MHVNTYVLYEAFLNPVDSVKAVTESRTECA